MKQYLEQNEWPHEAHEDGLELRGAVSLRNGQWLWHAEAVADQDLLSVHGMVPVRVPRPRLSAAAELLHRINWHLRFGNFEMDLDNGAVEFRTTLSLHGRKTPSRGQLKHLLESNCCIIDYYLPGLMSVAFGKTTPEEALKRADAEPAGQQADETDAHGPLPGSLNCREKR